MQVAQQCKENIFAVQTLKDFQFVEDNKDQGLNVREKAKALVALLKDDERLKNERTRALKAKERFAQSTQGDPDHAPGDLALMFLMLQATTPTTTAPPWAPREMITTSASSRTLS